MAQSKILISTENQGVHRARTLHICLSLHQLLLPHKRQANFSITHKSHCETIKPSHSEPLHQESVRRDLSNLSPNSMKTFNLSLEDK